MRRLGALVLVIGALGAACSRSDQSSSADPAPSRPVDEQVIASSSTTAPVDPAACGPGVAGAASKAGTIGAYEVGRDERTVVDPSRSVVASGLWEERAAPERTLPVVILYPSAPEDGPFPIIMYSHGIGSAGTERNDTLERWASAGFVVVAPTFPLSSWTNDPSDMMNQPADVAFVLEAVRAAGAGSGPDAGTDVLNGLVRTDCVGLAGHSLGGFTTMAAAFDACCTSIRPTALVDIAGLFVAETAGGSLADMDPLPTLLVHGTLDRTLAVTMSESTRDLLAGPTWYLNFPDGDHNDMFRTPKVAVLDDAVVSFLTAWLYEDPAEFESLPERVDASGMASLETLRAG